LCNATLQPASRPSTPTAASPNPMVDMFALISVLATLTALAPPPQCSSSPLTMSCFFFFFLFQNKPELLSFPQTDITSRSYPILCLLNGQEFPPHVDKSCPAFFCFDLPPFFRDTECTMHWHNPDRSYLRALFTLVHSHCGVHIY
jgi:hypothetical protein